MRLFFAILTIIIFYSNTAFSGAFTGDLVFFPEGCQKTVARICKLGAEITYKSSIDNLVWQTDKWEDGDRESGTTDGASIPQWAQSIIGDKYDVSYLKAAIIHDHYCYKENHVRTWQQTHRMFYYALVDLGVKEVKAKTMYFAVYLFGPHWIKIVPGEKCGNNCIKNFSLTKEGLRLEKDQYTNDKSQSEIKKLKNLLENNPDMSVEAIETYAKTIKPNDFFLNHNSTYAPISPTDPNIQLKI